MKKLLLSFIAFVLLCAFAFSCDIDRRPRFFNNNELFVGRVFNPNKVQQCFLVEQTEKFEKYKIWTYEYDYAYFITVKNDTIVAIWSK